MYAEKWQPRIRYRVYERPNESPARTSEIVVLPAKRYDSGGRAGARQSSDLVAVQAGTIQHHVGGERVGGRFDYHRVGVFPESHDPDSELQVRFGVDQPSGQRCADCRVVDDAGLRNMQSRRARHVRFILSDGDRVQFADRQAIGAAAGGERV